MYSQCNTLITCLAKHQITLITKPHPKGHLKIGLNCFLWGMKNCEKRVSLLAIQEIEEQVATQRVFKSEGYLR
jgi:hypothetical protein